MTIPKNLRQAKALASVELEKGDADEALAWLLPHVHGDQLRSYPEAALALFQVMTITNCDRVRGLIEKLPDEWTP